MIEVKLTAKFGGRFCPGQCVVTFEDGRSVLVSQHRAVELCVENNIQEYGVCILHGELCKLRIRDDDFNRLRAIATADPSDIADRLLDLTDELGKPAKDAYDERVHLLRRAAAILKERGDE